MNELRLQYHRYTGIRIQDHDFDDPEMEEYVEWLEERVKTPDLSPKGLVITNKYVNK